MGDKRRDAKAEEDRRDKCTDQVLILIYEDCSAGLIFLLPQFTFANTLLL
jgi:hypothetical protein